MFPEESNVLGQEKDNKWFLNHISKEGNVATLLSKIKKYRDSLPATSYERGEINKCVLGPLETLNAHFEKLNKEPLKKEAMLKILPEIDNNLEKGMEHELEKLELKSALNNSNFEQEFDKYLPLLEKIYVSEFPAHLDDLVERGLAAAADISFHLGETGWASVQCTPELEALGEGHVVLDNMRAKEDYYNNGTEAEKYCKRKELLISALKGLVKAFQEDCKCFSSENKERTTEIKGKAIELFKKIITLCEKVSSERPTKPTRQDYEQYDAYRCGGGSPTGRYYGLNGASGDLGILHNTYRSFKIDLANAKWLDLLEKDVERRFPNEYALKQEIQTCQEGLTAFAGQLEKDASRCLNTLVIVNSVKDLIPSLQLISTTLVGDISVCEKNESQFLENKLENYRKGAGILLEAGSHLKEVATKANKLIAPNYWAERCSCSFEINLAHPLLYYKKAAMLYAQGESKKGEESFRIGKEKLIQALTFHQKKMLLIILASELGQGLKGDLSYWVEAVEAIKGACPEVEELIKEISETKEGDIENVLT